MKAKVITKQIPLDKIVLSKDNPRREFPPNSMEELTQSIKENGLQQAIKVRPKGKLFELVFGERRLKAHKTLKVKTIRADVENLTDDQARIARLIENYREDVHPLDEANHIASMLDTGLFTVETVVGKTGKPKSYIAGRLQLLKLIPDAHKLYAEGKIELGHALLIAKVPEISQVKLLTYLNSTHRIPSVAELKMQISDHVMHDLNKASFQRKDKLLFPDAGSCNDCFKRTGNAEDLFTEFSGKNLCTDGICYKEKERLHIEQVIDRAEAAGTPLIKVSCMNFSGNKKLLGTIDYEISEAKNALKAIIMDGLEKGKVISIMMRQEEESKEEKNELTDKQKLNRLNAQIMEQRNLCVYERISEEILQRDLQEPLLPMLMDLLLKGEDPDFAGVLTLCIYKNWIEKKERHGYYEVNEAKQIFEIQISKLTYPQKIELLNQSYIIGSCEEPDEEKLDALAKYFTINTKEIRKKVEEELPLLKKLPEEV